MVGWSKVVEEEYATGEACLTGYDNAAAPGPGVPDGSLKPRMRCEGLSARAVLGRYQKEEQSVTRW
jgi:hypothetical protein